jgi:RNA polymerase sigma factor (sigma-70 family)
VGNHADPRFNEADAAIIKRKAKRLAGHYGYRISDVEDIEQDLAMHVFQQTHRHEPGRGSREKFVSKVAKNKLLNLIEKHTAKKRDRRRDVPADDVGEGALLDGGIAPDRIDLVIDVREAIARLPEDLRQVAVLRQQHSEKELEGLLNLTRAQVRGRLQRLERLLREAGLAPDSEE